MAAAKEHRVLLKKLKHQVSVLQRKEERNKSKLKIALKKLKRLSKSCQPKLASQIRIMKVKMGDRKQLTYPKVAVRSEKKLKKKIGVKGKITCALGQLEKKHKNKAKAKDTFKKSKKRPAKINECFRQDVYLNKKGKIEKK